MTTAQPGERRRFPGLDAIAIQHPYDRAALGALQRIPGLDILIRRFIELFPERVAYIQNVAQTVRVSPRQCPQLYAQLQEACAILDVREPELYVANFPQPNAWTSGHDHPYITVTTGLLDLMNEDEILAVLAHELGHIKSGHVLYKTMARIITLLLQLIGHMTLGIGELIGQSLKAALMEWDRQSEFTADRTAMLVVQDSQVMLSLMMKFAGGTLFQRDQMDAQEFLRQADLYEAVDARVLDRIYKLMLITNVDHPLTIVRAREIIRWSESREYSDILEGNYPHVRPDVSANGSRPSSGSGGNTTTGNRPTGGDTGTAGSSGTTATTTSEDVEMIYCPHCGHRQTNKRFCSLCGGSLE